MRESPRFRRLKSDLVAVQQLAGESTIFAFTHYGSPPDYYILRFRGRGLWKPHPQGEVRVREEHEVHVRLGASYPRMMPDLAWKTPLFHPNVSTTGVVCLGGYGSYWVPSLSLCELCCMLWDVLRYENFDEKSPYNREAAAWVRCQTDFALPIDRRPLRDKLTESAAPHFPTVAAPPLGEKRDVRFLSEEVVEAQLVQLPTAHRATSMGDILFIE